MTKHLYIHIPFCKSICHYCDFVRFQKDNKDSCIKRYLQTIKQQVAAESKPQQYTSIYLGGGTPNFLTDEDLNDLLSFLFPYLDTSAPYEFCLELNPEFVTDSQVAILRENGINRVSIGVQTTNNEILRDINRIHTIEDVKVALERLYLGDIFNISCDFIYALPKLTMQDIDDALNFIDEFQIHHVSFYALEVKEGSYLNSIDYEVDEDVEADQMLYINEKLEAMGLHRYEVSNWARDEESQSIHNKAYWLTNDWKAIGLSASGFENQTLYKWEGTLNKMVKQEQRLTTAEYYLQILMMGLRLVDGIDVINNPRNAEAYAMYFNDIVNCRIRGGKLQCKNINLLHETLVNIVDETPMDQLENSKNNH